VPCGVVCSVILSVFSSGLLNELHSSARPNSIMTVNFKIATGFRYYVPDVDDLVDGADFEVPEGSTVGEFLEMVHFPLRLAKMTLVNGNQADEATVLNDNDQIYLLQPMLGG
jgi:sulfur carrier protein ThiS